MALPTTWVTVAPGWYCERTVVRERACQSGAGSGERAPRDAIVTELGESGEFGRARETHLQGGAHHLQTKGVILDDHHRDCEREATRATPIEVSSRRSSLSDRLWPASPE